MTLSLIVPGLSLTSMAGEHSTTNWNSAKNKHATRHFHATQHAMMQSAQPGENWGWCYIDQRMFESI